MPALYGLITQLIIQHLPLPTGPAGVEVALRAMAAPQWEVRNAATLCYTALLVRILGFRNTATKVGLGGDGSVRLGGVGPHESGCAG